MGSVLIKSNAIVENQSWLSIPSLPATSAPVIARVSYRPMNNLARESNEHGAGLDHTPSVFPLVQI